MAHVQHLTRDKNPPAFKIHLIKKKILSIYYLHFICFVYFFTITDTPSPYPRSVSGSRIRLGGF